MRWTTIDDEYAASIWRRLSRAEIRAIENTCIFPGAPHWGLAAAEVFEKKLQDVAPSRVWADVVGVLPAPLLHFVSTRRFGRFAIFAWVELLRRGNP